MIDSEYQTKEPKNAVELRGRAGIPFQVLQSLEARTTSILRLLTPGTCLQKLHSAEIANESRESRIRKYP